jgi:hypothetical protein
MPTLFSTLRNVQEFTFLMGDPKKLSPCVPFREITIFASPSEN